jgi:hypothetical protein
MYNWSTNEKQFKKADPKGYQIWRMEQMINYGLQDEKLSERLLRKHWDEIYMDAPTRKYLGRLLWPKKIDPFKDMP